jgi:hypothetical protein
MALGYLDTPKNTRFERWLMDRVIRKHNATLRNPLQYACPKQNMNIAVDRADVAFRPASYLANSHSPLRSAHRLGVSVFQSRSSDANETHAPSM